MLSIEALSPTQTETIEREARARFHCGPVRCRTQLERDNCEACCLLLRSPDTLNNDGSPCVAGWELAYLASNRVIPRAWAGRMFHTLGTESPYAARVRGYLMATGIDSLVFAIDR